MPDPPSQLSFYYDELYSSSWLGRHSNNIRNFLLGKNFRELNAHDLKDWITERISERNVTDSVVVFSQDIMPDTVFSVKGTNCLIRKYLDSGGRIIWMGDIPFWYRSHKFIKEPELLQHEAIPQALLGVTPFIAETSSLCKWIPCFNKRKMESHWYSMRPISLEIPQIDAQGVEETIGDLKVEALAYAQIRLLPSPYNILNIYRWKKSGKKVGGVNFQAGITPVNVGGGIQLGEYIPKELDLKKEMRLACAWKISFDKKYGSQGFYRFLDCDIDEINVNILNDVYRLATY